MKEWQKVSLGILGVLMLTFAVDRILGGLMEHAYKHSKYGIFHRQEYCLHKSRDEIVILGSSRAAHHYIPQILTDSLNLSCFNCGSDGQCVYYSYGILSSYIHRGAAPKVVIYEVMPLDIEKYQGSSFNLDAAIDRFLPVYGEFPVIDSLVALNGWKEKIKILSDTYRYNSDAVQLIKCNFLPEREDRGYEAIYGQLDVKLFEFDKKQEIRQDASIDKQKEDCLRKLIHLCKVNNIKMIMCYSPYYNTPSGKSIALIKEIAEESDIQFWDYSRDVKFNRPEFFYDIMHLNDIGAKCFSSEIAHRIISIK
jgi:hypothetical protein